jgi:2-polyprenyl-6-methoxyphenol hydroxylase-like FAD-dependent oxidoreductase
MSPVGGVGINLAVQDAIATANILASGLGCRSCSACSNGFRRCVASRRA